MSSKYCIAKNVTYIRKNGAKELLWCNYKESKVMIQGDATSQNHAKVSEVKIVWIMNIQYLS